MMCKFTTQNEILYRQLTRPPVLAGAKNETIYDRAAGSNLRMVRPSLMSVVKVLIIRARSARQKLGSYYF